MSLSKGFVDRLEYTFIEPMLTMVSMGDLVTITSDLAPLRVLKNIRLIKFERDIPVELDIVWKKKHPSAAVQLFVRHIMEFGLP